MSDGRIIIDTKLDNTGLEKGINSLNDVATKGLKILTGAVIAGGAALTGLGIKAIGLASDLSEVQNVVDVTFGSDANKINKWAKDAAKSFGMSELQAKKFNGTMGAMLKSMGLSGDQVYDLSTSMTGLAADFASFYNLEHEEAFDKIRAGISGETEPLKQLGINMSVANLEAFALTQGITKQYKEMNQAEQALLRYNYLMQAGADAQGDFARTSDGFANQMRIAKLNLESLTADIGTLLLPVAEKAVQSFNDVASKLKEAFSNPEVQASILSIAESIGELITKVANFVADYLPDMINGLAWILDNSGDIAAGIAAIGTALASWKILSIIATVLPTIIGFVSTLFLEIATAPTLIAGIGGVVSALGGPVTIVIAIISALVGIIIYLWNTSDGFRNTIIGAWEKIKEVALDVWGYITDCFTKTIPDAFNRVKSFFTEDVPKFFSDMWDSISQFFINGWNSVVEFFTVSIPAFFDDIYNWFSELPYKIGYWLGEQYLAFQEWWQSIINFFTVSIPAWIDSVGVWFSELPGRIKAWFDETLNNISMWFDEMYTKCETSITETINSISDWFSALPDRISTWFDETITGISNWGSEMYDKASRAVEETVNGIIDWFKDLPNKMYNIGMDIIKGIGDGILGAKDWLWGKITGIGDGIVDGFKDALDIHSPSRIMRDIIGTNLVKGIGVGVDLETPNLEKDINANMADLTAKLKSTVDYETAKTTAGVVAQNNITIGSENNATRNYTPSFSIIAKVSSLIDSELVAEHTTPMVIENISEEQNSYSIAMGGN